MCPLHWGLQKTLILGGNPLQSSGVRGLGCSSCSGGSADICCTACPWPGRLIPPPQPNRTTELREEPGPEDRVSRKGRTGGGLQRSPDRTCQAGVEGARLGWLRLLTWWMAGAVDHNGRPWPVQPVPSPAFSEAQTSEKGVQGGPGEHPCKRHATLLTCLSPRGTGPAHDASQARRTLEAEVQTEPRLQMPGQHLPSSSSPNMNNTCLCFSWRTGTGLKNSIKSHQGTHLPERVPQGSQLVAGKEPRHTPLQWGAWCPVSYSTSTSSSPDILQETNWLWSRGWRKPAHRMGRVSDTTSSTVPALGVTTENRSLATERLRGDK